MGAVTRARAATATATGTGYIYRTGPLSVHENGPRNRRSEGARHGHGRCEPPAVAGRTPAVAGPTLAVVGPTPVVAGPTLAAVGRTPVAVGLTPAVVFRTPAVAVAAFQPRRPELSGAPMFVDRPTRPGGSAVGSCDLVLREL
ncbi:unnamed protein product [Lampetra planeri]